MSFIARVLDGGLVVTSKILITDALISKQPTYHDRDVR